VHLSRGTMPPSNRRRSVSRIDPAAPPASLSLWDAISIIVGVVIGAGLYETAPLVLANVSGPGGALAVWLLGGALSLVGACCYAELATTYPRLGGDYVYLTRAFGPLAGFLFGWSQLAVLLTGSIGMMAYVFADYATAFGANSEGARALLAALVVVVLTLLNIASVGAGKVAQNTLTWVKIAGLVAVAAVGFFWAASAGPRTPIEPAAATAPSFGLAMILVLYTYGGWNDAAFIAAEVRDRSRNMPRALLLGTGLITLVYLLVNAAFVAALGFDAARSSQAIAADVLRRAFGSTGGQLISALVMVSALGAVNALILTGARVHAGLGADYSSLSALGYWHERRRSPLGALVAQAMVTLALIALLGTQPGRRTIDASLGALGLAPAQWSGHGGFDTLLRCTAPVFWLFFLMTSVALFVLRRKDRDRERPFRVPLYPLLPLVFSGTCLYMLISAVDYAGSLSLVGASLVLLGLPLYFASKQRPLPLLPQSNPASSPAE
jgi:APA family basic amino acid/polyamine antiporter